jgi:hypothetical protein
MISPVFNTLNTIRKSQSNYTTTTTNAFREDVSDVGCKLFEVET